MEEILREKLNEKLKYIPFKGYIINKILPVVNDERFSNKLLKHVESMLKVETNNYDSYHKSVCQSYMYPKQIVDGEKSPYDYHDYLKNKVKFESCRVRLSTLMNIKNEIKKYTNNIK